MNIEQRALINNTTLNRFEIPLKELVAILEYKIKGNKIYLLHTEVPDALQGLGIAQVLVEKVMQWIEKREMRMVPYCPYVLQFLKKHPNYNELR